MKGYALAVLLALTFLPATVAAVEDLGAHRFRGMDEFQRIIDTKCTVCHTRERVDIAIRNRRDLAEIERLMLKKGAILSSRDKKVLGTFWGDPIKRPARDLIEEQSKAYREYRQIIEKRCTLCHTRDRIDDAIRRQLPLETVEEVLLRRGVVLTERERSVLGTFWGTPLKK